MAISQSEPQTFTCLACATAFESDIWNIVDASERPDLAQALMDGSLNPATCPACGASNQPQVTMLYHDPARKRVHLAMPSDADELQWREQGNTLLYTLAEALPEEARLPYLDDVHVNLEIAGVRKALQRDRRGRAGGAKPNFGKPIELPGSAAAMPTRAAPAAPVEPQPAVPTGNLSQAIENLMGVASAEELRGLVVRHPELLGDEADEMLRQLADAAFNQGDRDMSTSIHSARTALADLREGREPGAAPQEQAAPAGTPTEPQHLPHASYQALLSTASEAALMNTIRAFPLLLEPWADQATGRMVEDALEEGNERLATLIEDRRDALAVLRTLLFAEDAVERAMYDLLAANDTDATEQVLHNHPQLMTEAAEQVVSAYIQAATARGDMAGARKASERASLLQQVRTGIAIS